MIPLSKTEQKQVDNSYWGGHSEVANNGDGVSIEERRKAMAAIHSPGASNGNMQAGRNRPVTARQDVPIHTPTHENVGQETTGLRVIIEEETEYGTYIVKILDHQGRPKGQGKMFEDYHEACMEKARLEGSFAAGSALDSAMPPAEPTLGDLMEQSMKLRESATAETSENRDNAIKEHKDAIGLNDQTKLDKTIGDLMLGLS